MHSLFPSFFSIGFILWDSSLILLDNKCKWINSTFYSILKSKLTFPGGESKTSSPPSGSHSAAESEGTQAEAVSNESIGSAAGHKFCAAECTST